MVSTYSYNPSIGISKPATPRVPYPKWPQNACPFLW